VDSVCNMGMNVQIKRAMLYAEEVLKLSAKVIQEQAGVFDMLCGHPVRLG